MRLHTVFGSVIFGIAAMMTSAHGGPYQQYFAILDAGNQSDGGRAGAVGTATIMFGPGTNEICFAIVVRGVDKPTLAHIHDGGAGVDGGIRVTLSPPATGNPGTSADCVTTTAANIAAIKANPTKFYVNVHSTSKPNGALRGQLF
jgi:hypothetical protein